MSTYSPSTRPYLFCADVTKYRTGSKVGDGTFGEVFKAVCPTTEKTVALKRLKMEREKEGFPLTSLREIKILSQLKHENVLCVLEICYSRASDQNRLKGDTYIVVEFMDHDLAGLLENVVMSEPQIKCYVKQMINGLHYLHAHEIIHRDLKPANILISNAGLLKLADFGLARSIKNIPSRGLTNRVVTQWYRPPELLLCSEKFQMYSPAIDIWAVGCIVVEMYQRGKPLFPGKSDSEIDQLDLICRLCGPISTNSFPNLHREIDRKGTKVPNYSHYESISLKGPYKDSLASYLAGLVNMSECGIKFIARLLALDPDRRPSADGALEDDYFWTEPHPLDRDKLPKYGTSFHEFSSRKKDGIGRMAALGAQRNAVGAPSGSSSSAAAAHAAQAHHHHHHHHTHGSRAPSSASAAASASAAYPHRPPRPHPPPQPQKRPFSGAQYPTPPDKRPRTSGPPPPPPSHPKL